MKNLTLILIVLISLTSCLNSKTEQQKLEDQTSKAKKELIEMLDVQIKNRKFIFENLKERIDVLKEIAKESSEISKVNIEKSCRIFKMNSKPNS